MAAAALALSQPPVAEAQSASGDGERALESVLVTGSRLRRTDAETPSPVQVIGRDEIARSGAASLNEVLQKLPANNSGAFNEGTTVDSYGAAAVSLRGLGPGSTLVLINGRRVAPFGFTGKATFVDINQIPVGAIERVEVLLDGASAIYGSDAVAGVVNIILRRSYRGIEVAAGLGMSSHGDATERRASATAGFGDRGADGYNVFATLSHVDQDAVKASARWHTQSGDLRGFGLFSDLRSTNSYPGNLYTIDNRTFLQPLASCATIGDAASPGPGQCLYDPTRDSDAVVRSRRDALFVAGSAALGSSGFEVFGDATFSRNVFAGQHYSLGGTVTLFSLGTLAEPFIRLRPGIRRIRPATRSRCARASPTSRLSSRRRRTPSASSSACAAPAPAGTWKVPCSGRTRTRERRRSARSTTPSSRARSSTPTAARRRRFASPIRRRTTRR